MKQTRTSARLFRAGITAAVVVLIGACGSSPEQESVYQQVAGPRDDPAAVERLVNQVEDLTVVDCLLPGKLRKMGHTVTWVTRPRPVKQTATDCEILGGQYIAFDRANPTTALALWTSAAETGDPTAQAYVGEIYERGLGRARDYKTAAQWYRKAADQGHHRAQLLLGALYEKGLGIERNPIQALDWYRKAAGLSKDKVVYLSQALATARAAQARQSGGSASRTKARAQVKKIRSARKSSDRRIKTHKTQVAQVKQKAKKAAQRGRKTRMLDQQPSMALVTAKRRLIDQTVALDKVATTRDSLQAIEKLGQAVTQAASPSA